MARSLILGNREEQLTMHELSRALPRKCCDRTVYRWCKEGRRGVFLEHIAGTNGMLTSLEAYYRFMAKLQEQQA
jgi:hypothetical protein